MYASEYSNGGMTSELILATYVAHSLGVMK